MDANTVRIRECLAKLQPFPNAFADHDKQCEWNNYFLVYRNRDSNAHFNTFLHRNANRRTYCDFNGYNYRDRHGIEKRNSEPFARLNAKSYNDCCPCVANFNTERMASPQFNPRRQSVKLSSTSNNL